MNSGCALQFISTNQNISRQIQPRCEPAYHLQRKRAYAVQHRRDPGARADVRFQVFSRHPARFHDMLQEVDRIGRLDRVVLALVRFHQKREHFKPICRGRAAGRLPEHFDFPERGLMPALGSDRTQCHLCHLTYPPSSPLRSSLNSRCRFTAGHSCARIEYTQVSRKLPSECRWWLRRMPSCFAPRRSIARRLAWLKKLVRNSTAMQPSVSNACVSSMSLHSVLSGVRCADLAYQVEPISTRRLFVSMFM